VNNKLFRNTGRGPLLLADPTQDEDSDNDEDAPPHDDKDDNESNSNGGVPLLHPSTFLPITTTPTTSTTNQAAMWSCVAVLANNMMGAGTLGLPFAVAQTGWLLGGILLIGSAIMSAHGFLLLTLSAHTVQQRTPASSSSSSSSSPSSSPPTPSAASFYSLCQACIPRYTFLVDLAVAIKCFGVAISYLVIVGDLLPDVVKEFRQHALTSSASDIWEERWLWIVLAFLMVVPLSFQQRLSALRYTSGVSVGIVLCLAVVALMYASGAWNACAGTENPQNGGVDTLTPALNVARGAAGALDEATKGLATDAAAAAVAATTAALTSSSSSVSSSSFSSCRGRYVMARGGHTALQVLPIFVYSYTAHQNFGLLLNELKGPSPRRVRQTLTAATGLALLSYLLLAQAAYYAYGAALQHDLLSSFPASRLSTCLRAAMSLLVTFTYPLQAHPARACLLALWPDTNSSNSSSGSDRKNKGQLLSFRYTCVTLLFLFSSLLLALLIHDLSLVLEIVGATGSTTVSYLLPGLTYFLLHPWSHLRRRLAVAQVVVGMVVMGTCMLAILMKER